MAKKLLFDEDLRSAFYSGSKAIRRIVEPNYGPEGRNTIRQQTHDLPLLGNTGRRVLEGVTLQDPEENVAAVLVRDAALKVAAECGDGAIATAMLTDYMIEEGYRLIAAGFNPMRLRRGVHLVIPFVQDYLMKISIPFESVSAEAFAAATAKNEEVARNVTRAFLAVGADGIINIRDTQSRDTVLNIWDGVRYDYGLHNTCFANDPVHKRAVMHNPYVLLSNVKISSVWDIERILSDVISTNSALLIITNDMDEETVKILAANMAKGLQVVVASAPGFGETRRRNMLALAAKTGSMLFDENTGISMRDCGLSVCARIAAAEIDKDSTVLRGFTDGSDEMVRMLTKHTQKKLQEAVDPDEREKLADTLAVLNGKTAEILVGGVVEYEMFEKKYLYENTVRAIQNAARFGLVPGAGNAYVHLAEKLKTTVTGWQEEERAGVHCLVNALLRLAAALVNNAGDNSALVLNKLQKMQDPYWGYNVVMHEMCDLQSTGILLPRSTVERSIAVAADVGCSVWTTSAAVIEV